MDESKLKDQNILLVKEKNGDELKAVSSVSKTGKVELVDAKTENAALFLKFDRNDKGELAKIMSDFNRQKKNPDDFQLFQVRYGKFKKQKEGLEEVLSRPHNAEAKELLKPYAVDPKEFTAKQTADEPKVLLTQGEDGKLKAVTGMEQNGKLNTVDPTKENSDKFLEINPNGNVLENFMKKFSAQYEKPSHTGLYAVTASAVVNIAAFLDKIIKVYPDDKVLDPYRVQPDGQQKELSEGQQKYQALDLNKVDWKDAEKLGIPADALADTLKAMVYGHKSPGLVDIKTEVDGKEYSVKARLSLEQQPDGSFKVQAHPKQEQPDFEKPFMGVIFTKGDIEQFKQTGNGGRVFDLEHVPGGEKVPSLISLDKLTNRFETVALSEINIPQKLKGTELTPGQQEGLRTGKGVLVEGMDKRIKAGEEPSKIDRILQYNASNRNFDFRFTPEQREQHRQDRQAKQGQEQSDSPQKGRKVDGIWINPVQGGVKLTDDQFNKLLNKEPVFVEGMQKQQPKPKEGAAKQVEATDKKGQKYNAWVWPDAEAGRVRHTSKHPDEWKAIQAKKAIPAESHKTQVAVNNDGKTNEATKHSNEPLKPGQSRPTEKQAEKKAEKQAEKQSPKAPKKGSGRKIS